MINVYVYSGGGYQISKDGVIIVNTVNPLMSFNDAIKDLGLVGSVEVFDGGQPIAMPEISTEPIDVDDVIARMNATTSAPNIGKYKTVDGPNVDEDENEWDEDEKEDYDDDEMENHPTDEPLYNAPYQPVGYVTVPKLGDLIYVDGFKNVLKVITGGIGTVSLVYSEELGREIIDGETPTGQIMVELEEVPGTYFSWSDLRSRQNDLKRIYGYKPVRTI